MYTINTSWEGPSRGSPDDWLAWAEDEGAERLDELEKYLDTVYEFAPKAGIRAELVVIQSIHETTEKGLDGVWRPWTSYWWVTRLNPAGIGITGWKADDNASRFFPSGREAALGQLVRICKYVFGPVPDVLKPHEHEDPRGPVPSTVYGQKKTLESFGDANWRENPTWAADDDYGQKLADKLNRLEWVFENSLPLKEEPDMATFKTVIPGLSGGPLTTLLPVHIRLIPWSRHNRPGIKLSGPFDTTQHATANWYSDGESENGYVVGGSGGRMASWHITVDEKGIWISLPFDEVGWHASDGSGPGNMSTVACELTQRSSLVNNPTLWRIARRAAADIMGRVAARKSGDDDPSFHRDYAPDRKFCPEVVLSNSVWTAEYDADYTHAYYDEKRLMGGGSEEPDPGVNFGITDVVTPLYRLNFRQGPATTAPVIRVLEPGTEITVTDKAEFAGGYEWLPVTDGTVNGYVAVADPSGTAFLDMVTDNPDPEPEPDYVDAKPIPVLLETDLQKHDTAEGVISDDNGNHFVFVADVIEFTAVTVAGEYATENPRPVKAPFKIGDRAIAAWLFEAVGLEDQFFYVLAGPGNEWIRVPYANTKRISDAPLLPGQEWSGGDGSSGAPAVSS